MSAAVVVALIALVGTLANAGLTYMLTIRSERQRAIRRADAQWSRILSSLAQSATDLTQRIENLLRGHFLDAYGTGGTRRDEAIRSTLFRFAQYFGWSEILRRALREPDPRHASQADELERLQDEIGRMFASDRRYGAGQFMVWREAQRAIGELMLVQDDAVVDTVGVAGFIERLDSIGPWMHGIMGAMALSGPSEWQEGDRRRLADIADRLNSLAETADRFGARTASRRGDAARAGRN